MKKVLFKRRQTKDIPNVPIIDGQLVYDTETGATYMDVGDERISTGGGGGGGAKTASELSAKVPEWIEAQPNTQSVVDSIASSSMKDNGYKEVESKVVVTENASIIDNKLKCKIKNNSLAVAGAKVFCFGKNILPFGPEFLSSDGIEFKRNKDGSVTINGTATGQAFYYFDIDSTDGIRLNSNDNPRFQISGQNYDIAGLGLSVEITLDTGAVIFPTQSGGKLFKSLDYDGIIRRAYIFVESGTVLDNVTIYPMISYDEKHLPGKYEMYVPHQTVVSSSSGYAEGILINSATSTIFSDSLNSTVKCAYKVGFNETPVQYLQAPKTFTVGDLGEFSSLSEAIKEATKYRSLFENGGSRVEIKILSGTTIKDQISVVQEDLQYITLISEDAEVPVDASAWGFNGLNGHDLRGDIAFIGGENAAKLPTVGCTFKLTVPNIMPVVGYFANRGSSGVILSGCGFDAFDDGVIANNESSVTARESVIKNAKRWGIHARHNGEISARSITIIGAPYADNLGVYADRIADIDIRSASISSCNRAICASNLSRINANGVVINDCDGSSTKGIVEAGQKSTINCSFTTINRLNHGPVFVVTAWGEILSNGSILNSSPNAHWFSQPPSILTQNGVIDSNVENPPAGSFLVTDGTGGFRTLTLENAAEVGM